MTAYSPLGIPLPETVGRQHIPSMDEIARELGGRGAVRDGDEVRHQCPDCGGTLATGVIHVELCRTCGGVGTLGEGQMTALFGGGRVRPV